MFGYTEAQLANYGLYFGVGGLIVVMLFIVLQLAWESKAGKTGTLVLLLVLMLGVSGLIIKEIIIWRLEASATKH